MAYLIVILFNRLSSGVRQFFLKFYEIVHQLALLCSKKTLNFIFLEKESERLAIQ